MQRSLVVVLAIVVFAALPVAGQKFLPKTIQFKGDPEYSDQELLDAAGLKKGTVLSSAEMNDHSKRLMDSGVFDSLTFKFDGQDLIFLLTPSTQLYPVRLANLPLTPGKDLDAKLHDRLPLYHGNVPTEGGLLDEVRGALEEILATRGIQATVKATQVVDLKSHKITAVSFAITTPPVVVGEIHPEATSAALDPKAQEILAKLSGSPYDTEGTANQLEVNLGNYYRDQGYLETEVRATNQTSPEIGPDSIRVPIAVSVHQGLLYKLSSVTLAPGLLVTQTEFDKTSGLSPGAVASRLVLQDGLRLIEHRYHARGYMLAQIKYEPTFDRSNGTVAFTVSVLPGDVYHLSTVKFENVSDDLRRALLHNWQMAPDDVFDETYVQGFPGIAAKQDPSLAKQLSYSKYEWRMTLDTETRTVALVVRITLRTPGK